MNALYSRSQQEAETEVTRLRLQCFDLQRQIEAETAASVESARYFDLARLNTEQHAQLAELQRQVDLGRNFEASLRRELAEQREDNARWRSRNKALEARLEHIAAIASGHAVVEGADDGAEGDAATPRADQATSLDDLCPGDVLGKHDPIASVVDGVIRCQDCGAS
jgi:chromosome segregation ATPase